MTKLETNMALINFAKIIVILVVYNTAAVSLSRGDNSSTPVHVRIGSFQTAIDYAPYIITREKHWIEDALQNVDAIPAYLPTFQ